jgi:hypothetical protein
MAIGAFLTRLLGWMPPDMGAVFLVFEWLVLKAALGPELAKCRSEIPRH